VAMREIPVALPSCCCCRCLMDGSRKYQSEITTDAGHFDSSNNRSRSLAAMHRRNALRSEIGPVSSRHLRGLTLKHDMTETFRLRTKRVRSLASHEVRTLSTQKTAFLIIDFCGGYISTVTSRFPCHYHMTTSLSVTAREACLQLSMFALTLTLLLLLLPI